MTFESEGLLIVAIYTWLPPASYVVFSDNSGLVLGQFSISIKGQITRWNIRNGLVFLYAIRITEISD